MSLRNLLRPEQIRELSMVLIVAVAIFIFGTQIEEYYTARTFNRIALSVAIIAVVAVGQTLVIITRNVDLSVGSIVGFTAYFLGQQLSDNNDLSPVLAVLLAVGVGALMGLVNGVIVAYGNVPAIVVTLGTLAIYRGMLVEYSNAESVITAFL
ncbi:MAG: ABC transporter permease, partial [Anaerolineales bacterium]